MKKQLLFLFVVFGLVLANSCLKEKSLENGNGPSKGTLQDDGSGDCLPKTVNGSYVVGTALDGAVNYIEVEVDVTSAGSWAIHTDTVNGIYFRGSGVFTTTGLNTVRLKGFGTPTAVGISNFVVTYGTSQCTIPVTVVASLAVFTLDGAPGGCMGATVAGIYNVGTVLDATNTVTIHVTVTTAGAYNISTTVSNGMTFSGFGTLATGTQTIVLTGAGTPTSTGNTNIPVTVGGSSCSFTINVGGTAQAATYTVDCATATVQGTYTVGTPLNPATNKVVLTVNVATPGTYTITATGGNMTFTASGSFASAGPGQTVTLVASSGNPNTPNANTMQLTGGTAGCTFTINVSPGGGGAAVFTINCAVTPTVAGTYTQNVALTASNTVIISVNVTTVGTYSITATADGMTFSSAPAASFTTTGIQPVTLTGTGTPQAAGTFFIPVPNGACNFFVLVATTSTDYFPRVTNDTWSYELDDVATDSVYRKVIAPTFTALSNTYNIFMQDIGNGIDSSGYYRRNGGDYFEYLDVGAYLGYDSPLRAEYTMLKDNVPQATNWKSAGFSGAIQGSAIMVRFSYTLIQKDVSVTVPTSLASITYGNVDVVEEKYEAFVGGTWIDITSQIDYYGKSYYARGIGLIKYESYNAAGVVQDWQELRRYVVY